MSSSLPTHPRISHTLMMNRILDDEAGFGSGYVPNRLYPLFLGRTCRREKITLSPALPAHIAVKKPGWKLIIKFVAASRFGQQNVSRRGEAMFWAWRRM